MKILLKKVYVILSGNLYFKCIWNGVYMEVIIFIIFLVLVVIIIFTLWKYVRLKQDVYEYTEK